MRCSRCGSSYEDGEAFCPECGIRVAGVQVHAGCKPAGTRAQKDAVSVPPGGATCAPGEPTAPVEPPAPASEEAAYGSGYNPPGSRTSGFAVASLALGIAGLLICPFLGCVLAVIFGFLARSEIKGSGGGIKGSGLATAGLTLGIIGIVMTLIIASVLIPVGVFFVRPEIRAAGKLLDGAAAARIYYFENDDSYEGMRERDLRRIDDTVEFRMAPGKSPDVVYIGSVSDQRVRMYCYSSRGNRYTASARGEEWRYGFRYWHGTMRMLDGWYEESVFE